MLKAGRAAGSAVRKLEGGREGGREMEEAAIAEALRQWRAAPPQASWDEIETEVQRQLAGLQAEWMAQLAGASSAGETVPTCPDCGGAMRPCGQRTRQMLTRMGRAVPLERPYYVCPAFSPLDEALDLPAHSPYSPQVLSGWPGWARRCPSPKRRRY